MRSALPARRRRPLRHRTLRPRYRSATLGLEAGRQGGRVGKKRAAVAVARKLSVLLLRLWLSGEVYEPLRNARLRGELAATPS